MNCLIILLGFIPNVISQNNILDDKYFKIFNKNYNSYSYLNYNKPITFGFNSDIIGLKMVPDLCYIYLTYAFKMWGSIINQEFLYQQDNLDITIDVKFYNNYFINSPKKTLAKAQMGYNGSLGRKISLNVRNYNFKTRKNFLGLIIHQIGHILGLNDNNNIKSVMNSYKICSISRQDAINVRSIFKLPYLEYEDLLTQCTDLDIEKMIKNSILNIKKDINWYSLVPRVINVTSEIPKTTREINVTSEIPKTTREINVTSEIPKTTTREIPVNKLKFFELYFDKYDNSIFSFLHKPKIFIKGNIGNCIEKHCFTKNIHYDNNSINITKDVCHLLNINNNEFGLRKTNNNIIHILILSVWTIFIITTNVLNIIYIKKNNIIGKWKKIQNL